MSGNERHFAKIANPDNNSRGNPMTLSQIRRRVNALKRKFVLELAITSLLPWASQGRYREFFNRDLPVAPAR